MDNHHIAIILTIKLIFCLRLGETNTDLKCTPEDPRSTYEECMMDKQKVLWCDISDYKELPIHNDSHFSIYDDGTKFTDAVALHFTNSCLQRLNADTLGKYSMIEELHIDDNMLTIIETKNFKGNSKLKILNLSMNKISVIEHRAFWGLVNLEDLNLSNNKISLITRYSLQGTRYLKVLQLQENDLQVIDQGTFRYLPNLEELNLAGNEIRYIEEGAFLGLSKLQRLHLDGNRLQRMGYLPPAPIRVLTLSYNNFKTLPQLPKDSLSNLLTLDFNHNMLESFDVTAYGNLSKLQSLSLANNSLKNITDEFFKKLPHLRSVNLSYNPITAMSDGAFSTNCYLQAIDLSYNRLTTPSPYWFTNIIKKGKPENVNLSGNEWECNCNAMLYHGFVRIQGKEWRDKLDFQCKNPKKFRMETLTEAQTKMECVPLQYLADEGSCNEAMELTPETVTFKPYTPKPEVSTTTSTTMRTASYTKTISSGPTTFLKSSNMDKIIDNTKADMPNWIWLVFTGGLVVITLVILFIMYRVCKSKCRTDKAHCKRESSDSSNKLILNDVESSRSDSITKEDQSGVQNRSPEENSLRYESENGHSFKDDKNEEVRSSTSSDSGVSSIKSEEIGCSRETNQTDLTASSEYASMLPNGDSPAEARASRSYTQPKSHPDDSSSSPLALMTSRPRPEPEGSNYTSPIA